MVGSRQAELVMNDTFLIEQEGLWVCVIIKNRWEDLRAIMGANQIALIKVVDYS